MNKIGIMFSFVREPDFPGYIRKAQTMGFNTCQFSVWKPECYTDENAEMIRKSIEETGFEISALWAGWSGPCKWNFTEGPKTIGLVPNEYRAERLRELKAGADFAEKIGVNKIVTHVGFLSNNPEDEEYKATVAALRELCSYLKEKNMYFLFETGQETPVTLLRTIELIGLDNVGVNLDTGNLILYGMGNPVDALDVFGKYVMGTHIKDGLYPTCGAELGCEVKVGEGRANVKEVVKRLVALGYDGPFTIEREISGDKQLEDIIDTKKYLEETINCLDK